MPIDSRISQEALSCIRINDEGNPGNRNCERNALMGPEADEFDLCIVGAGPGGFAGAMRAIDAGRKVCLIEGDEIGGTGVKWGALASKTMWELAKDYAVASKTDRGYRCSGLKVDYQAVRETVIQAVKEKQYQLLSQLSTFAQGRWNGPGSVTYLRGWAGFIDSGHVIVDLPGGGSKKIAAAHFLLCTGSKPRHFAHVPVDQERILDSDGVLGLRHFPKRLMIVGAGVTGCEYATIFSNFGQTQVLLVDHQPKVIPYEDDDVSDFVSRNLELKGVKIFHSTHLREIVPKPNHLEVTLDFDDGHASVMEVETVLISIGREPNIGRLNLAAAGITPDSGGYLDADQDCRVRGTIYAAGDVTHRPALVNMAVMESRHAVKHMFNLPTLPLHFPNMSTVMFFYPAVAAVGLSEKECRRNNIAYRVASYANALLPRAIAMRAGSGFVKIIVSDDATQKILGMRAAGPQVSNTIMSIALLIDQEKNALEVLRTMFPHPTMSEAIQECLRMLVNKSIYKPEAFPDLLSIRRWRPETGFIR
ncbi:MAG: NAD(P)/FAD-dependent oxidoreductase [Desulfobacteraceae bacterium]|nr:MAG: NAD(P)/FAD-dependent oxidoreductase [Desulfobacteraceae bacterium]